MDNIWGIGRPNGLKKVSQTRININMAYDPKIHHRRSIRLKGYDYSQAGLYYITMCVQNKDYLFGNIVDEQMIKNDAGKMVEKWYLELENKFPDIECGEYVVMPNHFHCIIENISENDVKLGDNASELGAPTDRQQ